MHSRSNNVKQNEAQSKGEDVLLVEVMFLIFTRKARESYYTVGDSGLCCVCVTSFERKLTPLALLVDSS